MRDPFKKKKKKPISILKRVAAAVLFVTLIAGSLILIPEVEAGLFKIFTDEYDDHSTITFSDENTPNIGRWYPEYIPDGFEETFYDDTFDNVVIIFENNEDRIVFQYVPASQGASMTFNSEHATPHDIKIQDFEATVYVTNDAKHQNYVVWSSEDQTTAFILFSRIDYTELIKIAKSISLVESE